MLTPCQTALHPEDRWFSVWLFLPLATCFSFLKTLRNRFTPLSLSCLIISRVRIKVLLMTLKGIRFAPRDPHQRLTPPPLFLHPLHAPLYFCYTFFRFYDANICMYYTISCKFSVSKFYQHMELY